MYICLRGSPNDTVYSLACGFTDILREIANRATVMRICNPIGRLLSQQTWCYHKVLTRGRSLELGGHDDMLQGYLNHCELRAADGDASGSYFPGTTRWRQMSQMRILPTLLPSRHSSFADFFTEQREKSPCLSGAWSSETDMSKARSSTLAAKTDGYGGSDLLGGFRHGLAETTRWWRS